MPDFLGIDIGGTKSQALIADDSGRVLGFGSAGAGNHEAVGYGGLRQVLKEITTEALQQAGLARESLAGAGFGIAGYDWPGEQVATLEAIRSLGLKCPQAVVNDAMIGLLAGAAEGWGIAVVAGTGENCWGRDRRGRVGRVTGNGEDMGEYGGAGSIVRKAIQSVAKAWSRRSPDTQLLEAMLMHTGAPDAEELLEGLALGRYDLDSGWAPVVVQTAEAGDQAARDILAWSGAELADLAVGVIRQLQLEEETFPVVMVGSIFQCSGLLRENFYEHVRETAPRADFTMLEAPPAAGGVLLAMEIAGLQASWEVRRALIAGARERLR